MVNPKIALLGSWPQIRMHQLTGLQYLHLIPLTIASLFVALGKFAVYAADQSESVLYSASAILMAHTVAVVVLFVAGKFIMRIPGNAPQIMGAIFAVVITNVFSAFLFRSILNNWNLDHIFQTVFQQFISLSFAAFIYLGMAWVFFTLTSNFNDVELAHNLLTDLSKKQLETTLLIRDSRTYAVREISLEIQSTRGTLANLNRTSDDATYNADGIWQLEGTLNKIENLVNKISGRFPGPVIMPNVYSKVRYSVSLVLSASASHNSFLPRLIAVVSFFGFCSWLSYFMSGLNAVFWGVILSSLSFGVFWLYEEYLVTRLAQKPNLIRIFAYETVVIAYLISWLLILGYFAGDNSGSYNAALAYAAIPFLFFNAGAILNGVISSSQQQRAQLTQQALLLRNDLAELEQIRKDEDRIWKLLFAGDIALSPTTASVMLRDAAVAKDTNQIFTIVANVDSLWNSVLLKLRTAT